jgi:inorganic phosphate transporter, PiT family
VIFFFISSGLFVGWSLGANDAANVFGTAVVSKMVKFKVAAIIAGIFVILGSVISGGGTINTLGRLGGVNALAGCFTVALAVGISITWTIKMSLPVSTSQSVIGAIIGWNIFTGSPTDLNSLTKILATWVICPILAASVSFGLYKLTKRLISKLSLHMLELDAYTRTGLIIVGAFASYLLGANNIANVVGMFVPATPFDSINIFNLVSISGTHILLFLGGVSIAIGIATYGYRVMTTVGNDLFKITPVAALLVVITESLILFLFSSEELEKLLINIGLPPLPLVPLSSTQIVIGAVIGIGLSKGGKGINYRVLGKIAYGWVVSPVAAGLIAFLLLFIVQNVFDQKVYKLVSYEINGSVLEKLKSEKIQIEPLVRFKERQFSGSANFRNELNKSHKWNEDQVFTIFKYSEIDSITIDSNMVKEKIDPKVFSTLQINALKKLHGFTYAYKWQFLEALKSQTPEWQAKEDTPVNRFYNKEIKQKQEMVSELFKIEKEKSVQDK